MRILEVIVVVVADQAAVLVSLAILVMESRLAEFAMGLKGIRTMDNRRFAVLVMALVNVGIVKELANDKNSARSKKAEFFI